MEPDQQVDSLPKLLGSSGVLYGIANFASLVQYSSIPEADEQGLKYYESYENDAQETDRKYVVFPCVAFAQ